MKKATANIFDNFPNLEDYIFENEKITDTSKLTQHEKAMVNLARFFEFNEAFDLNQLFREVDPEWIPFALDQLQTYFYEDTYLTKKQKPLMIKDSADLLNQTAFAELMNAHGFNMNSKKIHMQRKRGKLPKETLLISGHPYWLKEEAKRYIAANQKTDAK